MKQRSIDTFAAATSTTSSPVLSVVYANSSGRGKMLTDSLINNLIIGCNLPLSVVDNPHFRAFVHDLEAKYAPPCRQTLTYSLIPKLVEQKKASLQRLLDDSCYVSLTIDIWTDRRCHSYMAVTVHMVKDGCCSSNLLAFKAVAGSHTGQKIADELDAIVAEYSLKDKICFVVSNNASNMIKAMNIFFQRLMLQLVPVM